MARHLALAGGLLFSVCVTVAAAVDNAPVTQTDPVEDPPARTEPEGQPQSQAGTVAEPSTLPPTSELPPDSGSLPVDREEDPDSGRKDDGYADSDPAGRSLLHFDDVSFVLGFEGTYDRRQTRQETRTRLGQSRRQSDRTRRFEETVGLFSSGAILDERLLLFDVFARWGMSQESFTETRFGPDLHESPHGDLLEYDLVFTLFPQGKLSTTAYAQRLDSRIPRAFLPSLDQTRERYGVDLVFSDPILPMRMSFEHVWDELDSPTGYALDDEHRGRDTFRYEATWQMSERHSLKLEYEYDDRREEYSGSNAHFDTTRNYLTLNHTSRFGERGRSSWDTLARFQDETGDLARDNLELSTRLRLQHTDAFATNYSAQFLRDSFQGFSTRTWRGDVGLTHQLDESLTASVQFFGLRQNADGNADLTEWGTSADLAFSRENALGVFSANLSYNHVATDTDDGDSCGVVISESVTFRDPLPSYLVQTGIESASLVVTSADRTRVYLPGRDYYAVRVGRYTALRRIATGWINDRDTVVASYTYRVLDDYDIRRNRVDFRIRQALDFGLTPYYAMSIQDEDVDDDRLLSFRARDVKRHRVGVTCRRDRWSAGAEYEYNNDAIDPYRAAHCNGDVVLIETIHSQLAVTGRVSRFWFDGAYGLPSRNSTLLDLGLSYHHLWAFGLEGNAGASYRYEDDSLLGITRGVDLTTALEWKIGHFSMRVEAEYDVLDLPDSRDEGVSLWLKVNREIPLVGRPG